MKVKSFLGKENTIEVISNYATLVNYSAYLYPLLISHNIIKIPVQYILPSKITARGFIAEFFTFIIFLAGYILNYIPFMYQCFDKNISLSFVLIYSIDYYIVVFSMREGMLLL